MTGFSNKSKRHLSIVIAGLLFFIFLTTIPQNEQFNREVKAIPNKPESIQKEVKISKVSDPIYINNNWSAAKGAGICTGFGTYSQPYIIEDLIIDGNGENTCIKIENSLNYYFRIENCTLSNGWSEMEEAASIKLWNVSNGTFINNNCSNSMHGIYLEGNCRNNTITENIISKIDMEGIYLESSSSPNNTISKNDITDGYYYGIYAYSSKNIIIENNITNCERGIRIGQSNNTIVKNRITNLEDIGIRISGSNHTIKENSLDNCGFYVSASIEELITITLDPTNTVHDKPLYYYTNKVRLGSSNFLNAGQIILINCNDSLIANANVSYGSYGIFLDSCFNDTILNNNASYNNKYGIYLTGCNNNTLEGNTVTYNNNTGIYICESTYNTNLLDNIVSFNERSGISLADDIENCTLVGNVLNNNGNVGIYLEYALFNVTFSNNLMNNCGVGIDAHGSLLDLEMDSTNTVNGKPIKFLTRENNIKPSELIGAGQVILGGCDNCAISNLDLSYCGTGVIGFYGSNITISNCNFTHNGNAGVEFTYYDNITIVNNNFEENEYGIRIESSSDNVIKKNDIENSSISGIEFFGGMGCEDNLIIGNTILNCNNDGIYLGYESSYNNITGNLIKDNDDFGICIEEATCQCNRFYNNSFIANSIHIGDYGTNSYWNSSTIGNYWDNYTGGDANKDGYGDVPYNLFGSIDYHPIWDWKPPKITISSPKWPNEFGSTAPTFDVNVTDEVPNTMWYIGICTMWYTLDNGTYNYTFNCNGQINSSAWSGMGNGNVTIKFYAKDISGNIAFAQAVIVKFISSPGTPDNGDDDDDNEENDGGQQGDIFIIIIIIIVIGSVAGIGGGLYVKKHKLTQKTLTREETKEAKKQIKQEKKEKKSLEEEKKKIKKAAEEEKKKSLQEEKEQLKEDKKTERDVKKEAERRQKEAEKAKKEVKKEGKTLETDIKLIGLDKKDLICTVHRDLIDGSVYICPSCKSFYCINSASVMSKKLENCRYCSAEINVIPANINNFASLPKLPFETRAKIQQLESQIDKNINALKDFEEKYKLDIISQDEYIQLKASITDKMNQLIYQITTLKKQ